MRSFQPSWWGRAVLLSGLAGLLVSSRCDRHAARRTGDDLLAELARARPLRTIAPRLSIGAQYRTCTVSSAVEGAIVGATCAAWPGEGRPTQRIAAIAERAATRLRTGADPDALHAAALVDLLWPADVRKSRERSVTYLRSAARLADRPAPVMADLAAALLVLSEAEPDARHIIEAVETAARAVELEPRSAAPRFNLALALERLGLDVQATRAWADYLMVDSTSSWASEARRRPRVVRYSRPDAPGVGASGAQVASYVARAPQAARLVGWDTLLSTWGGAFVRNDTARATALLTLAESIGIALTRRGGDASLHDAVRVVRAHGPHPERLRRIAHAHREYADGHAAFGRGDFEAAQRSAEQALADAPARSPLAQWTEALLVASLVQQGFPQRAASMSRRLVAHVDTGRHPALGARARWVRGSALLRSGRPADALPLFRTASRLFARAGEHENAGITDLLSADAEYAAGDVASTYGSMSRALSHLRPHRGSVWLHNLLYIWAEAVSGEFPRAAEQLQEEGVSVAIGTRSPSHVAEARLARARLAAAAGDMHRAAAELRESRPLVDALPPGTRRDWLRADQRLAEAGVLLPAAPRAAVAALDSVVGFFETIDNPARLLPALVARAEARLADSRVADAEADLERALSLAEVQHDAIANVRLRTTMLDAVRRTVDQLVMRRVAAGQASDALRYLERGRASFAPIGALPSLDAARPLMGPPGHVLVEFALIGDTLLTWTVADTSVRLTRSTVERQRLVQSVERLQSALEHQASVQDLLPELTRLYDLLIRPVQARLGDDETPLVLVADGEIAGVPLAALYDSARTRYLIEAHPLRFVGRLRDVSPDVAAAPRPPRTALLVADPAFETAAFPSLDRLPGARAEVDAIAAMYPSAHLLAGAGAERSALLSGLARAEVAHYAGHAVFDDARPERSFLLLAPSSARGVPQLSASEIAELELRRVRLLVLSACRTSRPQAGRSGGFAGMTTAFLAAGVGGVVGSLWRVDDALTRPLMIDLHDAYRESGDGAAALRAAQRRAIDATDPVRRSPAAWAAFRYVGR